MSDSSKRVYKALDQYIETMKYAGKPVTVLRVTQKDYQGLLKAHNTMLRAQGKGEENAVPPYNGIPIEPYEGM